MIVKLGLRVIIDLSLLKIDFYKRLYFEKDYGDLFVSCLEDEVFILGDECMDGILDEFLFEICFI